MHLLRVEEIARDEQAAVDLGQTPAPLVVISASDSDLHGLAAAKRSLGDSVAELRLAALVSLHHPASLDLYLSQCLTQAEAILVRILGGRSYWPYGVDRLLQLRAERPNLKLILLSGEPSLDPQLQRLSDLPHEPYQQLQAWFTAGGAEHGALILTLLNGLAKGLVPPYPVVTATPPLPPFAVWDWQEPSKLRSREALPTVAILFYRAQILADDTAAVRALCAQLAAAGLEPLPIFVSSLKDSACQEFLAQQFAAHPPEVIVTLTGFAAGVGFAESETGFFAQFNCPILQAIQASSSHETWSQTARGLAPRDLAMSIVLPETDGRIGGAVISFKEAPERDPLTQCYLVKHLPDHELIAALVATVLGWVVLRRTAIAERRIAIMLANYPVRDGRIGNGVGLAVPESLLGILSSLRDQGYGLDQIPESAPLLM
ncbi:MAG: cobaltochelatase subunit CobN, partial [Alphaproteobacteria bacterium]|nr:cobaltochelatase subunit CobN [Alphaproteobacteria bacterium]